MPVITVAGTNGKGSVAAYASAILQAAGWRVGTFTSPHLRDYRERIRVQRREGRQRARSSRLSSASRSLRRRPDGLRKPISLTFFEYNALAAFLVFDASRLDAWVLEIGMGGRLDAVNVVDATVAVVVSIGLDHQEFLGTTHEAIAREKAGIFRADAPAVLGSRDMPEALEDAARAVGAPLKRLGCEFDFRRDGERWCYRGSRWNLEDLPPPALAGETQYANAATAIAAVEELALERSPAPAVAQGIGTARLEGRFQVIASTGVQWILDVAHNPDAARVLAANLEARAIAGRTLAVCGILADKDAAGVAIALAARVDEWWLARPKERAARVDAALAALIAPHLRTPAHAAAASPPPVPAHSRAAREGDGSSSSARFTRWRRHWTGWSTRDAAAATHLPILKSFHEYSNTHDGSTPQRTLGRGHDTGDADRAHRSGAALRPATTVGAAARRRLADDRHAQRLGRPGHQQGGFPAAARCLVRAAPPAASTGAPGADRPPVR